MEGRARASHAHQALSRLLSGQPCAALVEAVVSKYVVLSNEELEVWMEEPESYARCVHMCVCAYVRVCACAGQRGGRFEEC